MSARPFSAERPPPAPGRHGGGAGIWPRELTLTACESWATSNSACLIRRTLQAKIVISLAEVLWWGSHEWWVSEVF